MNVIAVAKEQQEDQIIDDGFSSDEELKHEEIVIEEMKKQYNDHHLKEEVKFKIPPPQEIKDKAYSLKPDLDTGWNHKIELPNPIPIIFDNDRFDSLIKRILKFPKPKAKLCYLGPRFQNTYYAWYDKRFSFPYQHIKAPTDMKFTNRPFCGQHWEAEDGIIFDSFFQSGNLDCVIQIGEREYDLFMRVDSNTAGHLQWFNFKMKNLRKLLKYKINICNFQKDKCLFSRGMKPYIYSEQRAKRQGVEWEQAGENVRFEKKCITAAKLYDLEMRNYYRLTFEYYTNYQNDEIQIAYCIPYTYSRLSLFLHQKLKKSETKGFLKMRGLEIPLLIIHQKADLHLEAENSTSKFEGQGKRAPTTNSKGAATSLEIDQIQKKCIIISGRAHPGESNGSHMMEGFIQFLCGDSKMAMFLRKHIVFKIVPMLNPDGVALGNFRTGLSGRDFNRQYKNPDKTIFPEVYHFKKLVNQNKLIFKENVIMFLDFHGHSTKKNTFMYGPEFPIIDKFYYESRIFPKLLGNATSMFRYYSCSFKINEFKETTARAVLLRKLYIPLSYTIETSNGSYFDYEKLKDVPYTEVLWKEMGWKTGMALFEYCELVVSAEKNRLDKIQNKKKAKEIMKKHNMRNVASKRNQGGLQNNSSILKDREEPFTIFSGMQNEKIKMLFEEIKKAEQNKGQQKVSDDEMSEGESDREDEGSDLSPAKCSYLFGVIKNKQFKSLSRCRMRKKKQTQVIEDHHFKTNIDDQTEIIELINQRAIQQSSRNSQQRASQQIFKKKNKIHVRKPVHSKEKIFNFQSAEDQKKTATTKIINFSFCSNSEKKRHSYDNSNKLFLANKLNFLELVAGKWSEERTRARCDLNNSRGMLVKEDHKSTVMDLSDQTFRKTFTYNLREKAPQERQSHREMIPKYGEINNTAFVPHKKNGGRFQHYKYRRLLLNNEHEDLLN